MGLPQVEFILQVNDETGPLMQSLFKDLDNPAPANFAVLLDPSCGLGVVPKTRQAPPLKGVHCGYAGGIGPGTVEAQLREVAWACEGHEDTVWIDMESGIRSIDAVTGRDVFDISCVRVVLEAVIAAKAIRCECGYRESEVQ